MWYDRIVKAINNDDTDDKTLINYIIYPWHGNRSLNNEPASNSRTALLNSKVMSYFRYSGYNHYFDTNWTPQYGITDLGIYNQDNKNIVKINSTYETGGKLTYNGTVDKLLGINQDDLNAISGYPITVQYRNISPPDAFDKIYSLDNRMAAGDTYSSTELPVASKVGNELVRM
jgi:hypothetical protein